MWENMDYSSLTYAVSEHEELGDKKNDWQSAECSALQFIEFHVKWMALKSFRLTSELTQTAEVQEIAKVLEKDLLVSMGLIQANVKANCRQTHFELTVCSVLGDPFFFE